MINLKPKISFGLVPALGVFIAYNKSAKALEFLFLFIYIKLE
jgi:phosphatidylserine synthase